ncbi:hypothetical protein AU184_04685 [Mycolicibacterium novocastrense]|uniref:ApeA N-terminal domain 1-containing protein n=1 Tax=Mycolicibacterium novocastrense TaxID=59813 RepID=UPI00074A6D45|nr:HEPN domain-containing protein [Mycolicibacterium novocastrense]KUH73191.1 hypothetical protein AU072_00960 [Mycolicibacterium novocastrense]KUH74274.1 hypothetical protein AU183_12955 [Mycolicibacterium novocastrense]KUH75267.1 hypothetical protein AU184_04685 [Mycolicibacterium novocastrense]
MNQTVGISGGFWVPENPAKVVRGRFVAEAGKDAEVALDAGLVEDPRVKLFDGGAALSSSVEDSVKAFLPVVIHGQLDDGQVVTLLDARNHGGHWPFAPPRYEAHAALIGTHVAGEDQLFSAVRFRIGHPYWLSHLSDGQAATVDDDGSTLSVVADEDGTWLSYASATPATLRQLDIRVVHSCVVLVELALHREVAASEVQLRVVGDDAWYSLHGESFAAATHRIHPRTLLPPEVLTVELFARWVPLNDRLDGLAAAVAHKSEEPLQIEALVASSLIEGLHRRLPYQQQRFPEAAKQSLRRIGKAARESAGSQAEAENLDRHSAMDAVMFLHDVSFRTRAANIVAEVCAVIPEVTESVADLPRFLNDVRNELAHHLLPKPDRDPLQVRVLRWIVASAVTRWLLRCLLLLRAGVDAELLRERIIDFQRFQFFRANTQLHVDELVQLGSPRP